MTDFIEVPGSAYRVVRISAIDSLSVRVSGKDYEVVGTIGSREFVLAKKESERAAKLFINKLVKGVSNDS